MNSEIGQTKQQGNLNARQTVGPQSDQGYIDTNYGTITGKQIHYNDKQSCLTQARGGMTELNFTFLPNSVRQKSTFTMIPNSSATGWNVNFLNFFEDIPFMYNYYEIKEVELLIFNGTMTQTTEGTNPGFCVLSLVPWSANFLVNNVSPTNDFTLLSGCEYVPLVLLTEDEMQNVEQLQQQYTFKFKPQYQQNSAETGSTNPAYPQKGQYHSGPIQILDIDGFDDTVWYGFIMELRLATQDTANTRRYKIPMYYRYTIEFTGRRYSTIDPRVQLFSKLKFKDIEVEQKILSEVSQLTTLVDETNTYVTYNDNKVKELMEIHETHFQERIDKVLNEEKDIKDTIDREEKKDTLEKTKTVEEIMNIEPKPLLSQLGKPGDDIELKTCKLYVNKESGAVNGTCVNTPDTVVPFRPKQKAD